MVALQMGTCVTCELPLVVEVDLEEDEDDAMVGSSSATTPQVVDDDVTLSCQCHFHWSVDLLTPASTNELTGFP